MPLPDRLRIEDVYASAPLRPDCRLGFDDIIDVRTPLEFEQDHIPGAMNLPVLSNEERVTVGTLYKHESFEAKRLGAGLISRNIAMHLEQVLSDKPKGWRPLVYCWRGGSRSGAMAHILGQIGWRVSQLEGGYKAYRSHVLHGLASLVEARRFRVVCGTTGSGKTRFLKALQEAGRPVLDLEGLAVHRGSLLGAHPDGPQPAQKLFESRLYETLRHLPTTTEIFVESESRKIGNVQCPEALITRMRASACLVLEVSLADRVSLLCEEYAHFFESPDRLVTQLEKLKDLQGLTRVEEWLALVDQKAWRSLVEDLLVRHYDPSYLRSIHRNFPAAKAAPVVRLTGSTWSDYESAARSLSL